MPVYPLGMTQKPEVTPFFDAGTNTISYVVRDPASNACAVFDAVMDFDYAAGRISFKSADKIIAYIRENSVQLEWLIETHAHADHLSAAPYIQEKLGGKIGIGEHICKVQEVFGKVFNEGTEFRRDGRQFDRLFKDGDTYKIGTLNAFAMYTPGHTPACMTHVIGDAAFVGDTLFMPDGGTARADFPGGDARQLYRSIKNVLSLPQECAFSCATITPRTAGKLAGKQPLPKSARRISISATAISEDEFVDMRTARDKTLGMPKLIIPSIQVNIRAGHLPPPEPDGKTFLKIPVNVL